MSHFGGTNTVVSGTTPTEGMTADPGNAMDLKLSFDPNTIEHLGFKMYSRMPNAVAELVANAYDADAEHVSVILDPSGRSNVTVRDDGHGMSPTDLADKYLRIGRNRRHDDDEVDEFSESGRRRVAGRKGLGKLALFGIGTRVEIVTKRAGEAQWTVVVMDWNVIRTSRGEYRPVSSTRPATDTTDHGTTIVVSELKRATAANAEALARSLSRLFNYTDECFSVDIRRGDGEAVTVDRELRYTSITRETTWRIPDDVPLPGFAGVTGEIYASVKPLTQELRGVTVYVNGRLANDAEFFGVPESSWAFSYLTGYIDADFIDTLDEDVIATDRRSISWDVPDTANLRSYMVEVLQMIARLRRDTRTKAKRERLRRDLGVDIPAWIATIQGPEAKSLQDVLGILESPESEIADNDRSAIVTGLSEIAPEYADEHWRHLHESIREASSTLYQQGNFYFAVLEAVKRYVADVRSLSGTDAHDLDAIHRAFGKGLLLDVAGKYHPGTVSEDTAKNLRVAQHTISQGVWSGFRSPIAHEQISELEASGAFTFQDCLDALSIISHLRRRLDDAVPCAGGATPGP